MVWSLLLLAYRAGGQPYPGIRQGILPFAPRGFVGLTKLRVDPVVLLTGSRKKTRP